MTQKRRLVRLGMSLALSCLFGAAAPQVLPASYVVHLASATSYDTRSRDEDTIHAALTVFVNGERKGTAIWDGKGWDGSRSEGRRWVTGLHIFGPSDGSTVRVVTGRLQETDAVQIVFQILNSAAELSSLNHELLADRIQKSMCSGGDGGSAWECILGQASPMVAGLPLVGCDGLIAADKFVYTAQQLRRKTETGDTVTIGTNYQGAVGAGCGQSIYGAIVTIARQ